MKKKFKRICVFAAALSIVAGTAGSIPNAYSYIPTVCAADTSETDYSAYTEESDGTYVYHVYSDCVEVYEVDSSAVDNLTTATIPDTYNGLPVVGVYPRAFDDCTKLEYITLPASILTFIDTSEINSLIGGEYGELTEEEYNAAVKQRVDQNFEDGISRFAHNKAETVKAISVNANNPYFSSVNGVLYSKDKTVLLCYPSCSDTVAASNGTFAIPDGTEKITSYAFNESVSGEAFVSVTLPDSITSISENAFDSSYLTKDDTLGIYTIGNWIISIGSRTDVGLVLPDNIVGIADYAGRNRTFSTIGITFNENLKYIGEYAFAGSNIPYVVLYDSLESIGDYAFYECTGLEDFSTSSNSSAKIGRCAFAHDTALTYVGFDGVSSIGQFAFWDCKSLEDLIFYSDVLTSIEDCAFYKCTGLEKIDLTNCGNLTSVTDAFGSCSALTYAMFPESAQTIKGEFNSSASLEYLLFENPDCEIDVSVPSATKIYGYVFSTAEKYASENNLTFVPLDADEIVYGDTNCNGEVNITDAVLIMSYVSNSSVYSIDEQGIVNADIYARGDGISNQDALAIQEYLSGSKTELPESWTD